eukprot:6087883-Pyramimonas_sp.AAC.1
MAGSVALIWVCCGPSWADPAVFGSARPRGHGRALRSDALPWGRRDLSTVEAQIVREGNDVIIQGGMFHAAAAVRGTPFVLETCSPTIVSPFSMRTFERVARPDSVFGSSLSFHALFCGLECQGLSMSTGALLLKHLPTVQSSLPEPLV